MHIITTQAKKDKVGKKEHFLDIVQLILLTKRRNMAWHGDQSLYLQYSPLDNHLLRICLIKTLPRKNPVGKNQW
jgi:hypothetical protein